MTKRAKGICSEQYVILFDFDKTIRDFPSMKRPKSTEVNEYSRMPLL